MKKLFFACFTCILVSWAATSSYSQSASNITRHESVYEDFIFSEKEKTTVKYADSTRLNDFNIRAVRSFVKDYKNVTDTKWSKLDNGFSLVCFTVNGVENRMLYNNKGICEWKIRNYSEDKLPHEIRHCIKRTYYDLSIYWVSEITINEITAYIVSMQDKTSNDKTYWKIIKVADCEMEVMKEYSEKNE